MELLGNTYDEKKCKLSSDWHALPGPFPHNSSVVAVQSDADPTLANNEAAVAPISAQCNSIEFEQARLPMFARTFETSAISSFGMDVSFQKNEVAARMSSSVEDPTSCSQGVGSTKFFLPSQVSEYNPSLNTLSSPLSSHLLTPIYQLSSPHSEVFDKSLPSPLQRIDVASSCQATEVQVTPSQGQEVLVASESVRVEEFLLPPMKLQQLCELLCQEEMREMVFQISPELRNLFEKGCNANNPSINTNNSPARSGKSVDTESVCRKKSRCRSSIGVQCSSGLDDAVGSNAQNFPFSQNGDANANGLTRCKGAGKKNDDCQSNNISVLDKEGMPESSDLYLNGSGVTASYEAANSMGNHGATLNNKNGCTSSNNAEMGMEEGKLNSRRVGGGVQPSVTSLAEYDMVEIRVECFEFQEGGLVRVLGIHAGMTLYNLHRCIAFCLNVDEHIAEDCLHAWILNDGTVYGGGTSCSTSLARRLSLQTDRHTSLRQVVQLPLDEEGRVNISQCVSLNYVFGSMQCQVVVQKILQGVTNSHDLLWGIDASILEYYRLGICEFFSNRMRISVMSRRVARASRKYDKEGLALQPDGEDMYDENKTRKSRRGRSATNRYYPPRKRRVTGLSIARHHGKGGMSENQSTESDEWLPSPPPFKKVFCGSTEMPGNHVKNAEGITQKREKTEHGESQIPQQLNSFNERETQQLAFFLQQLQQLAQYPEVIQQLANNPKKLQDLVRHPEKLQHLSIHPDTLLQLAKFPDALQQLANPEIRQLFLSVDVVQLVSNPKIVAQFTSDQLTQPSEEIPKMANFCEEQRELQGSEPKEVPNVDCWEMPNIIEDRRQLLQDIFDHSQHLQNLTKHSNLLRQLLSCPDQFYELANCPETLQKLGIHSEHLEELVSLGQSLQEAGVYAEQIEELANQTGGLQTTSLCQERLVHLQQADETVGFQNRFPDHPQPPPPLVGPNLQPLHQEQEMRVFADCMDTRKGAYEGDGWAEFGQWERDDNHNGNLCVLDAEAPHEKIMIPFVNDGEGVNNQNLQSFWVMDEFFDMTHNDGTEGRQTGG